MIGAVRGLLASLILCASLTTARAESPAEKEARQRYATAQKLADGGHWSEALVEYRRSYELSHYPALLYRIAFCHDQLGHTAEALQSYKQFLAEQPESDRRPSVEARIAVLERETNPPPPREAPSGEATPANAAMSAAPGPSAPPRTPLYKKWWLWTIVGVAAAGAAVGIGVGVALSQRFQPDLGSFGPSLSVRW
jgi:tetratricopeptide (TPR) repeat protein